jgi:beta,beta-carotene 9',10'-dioxygenase
MGEHGAHSTFACGFADLDQEVSLERLPVRGAWPAWLTGTLVRNGPCKFDLGRQTVRHWFDGLAMLHKFSFAEGRVSYANRFLDSEAYRGARKTGRLARREFATDPCRTLFQRVLAIFFAKRTDNCSISINALAREAVAFTETTLPIRFDPDTLKTLGYFAYAPEIGGTVSSAHLHHDAERRCQFNYVIEFARKSRYRLFAVADDGGAQSVIAELAVAQPAYMHSFGMTRRHLVLAEFPFVVSPFRLLLRGQPFIRNYRWEPERGLRLHVIEKDGGGLLRTVETDAAFAFHHVNAFERGGELMVDLITYPDAGIIDQLYLARLRSAAPFDASGRLTRYVIPFAQSEPIRKEPITDAGIELPRIDYGGRAGRRYRYVWGAGVRLLGNFLDSLVKVDVETGRDEKWWEDGCYPGEPVFVPTPGAEAEGEGVLLSVVLDAARRRSFLLLLDAQSMAEIARAECPHQIPFGFHGNYFPSTAGGVALEVDHRH